MKFISRLWERILNCFIAKNFCIIKLYFDDKYRPRDILIVHRRRVKTIHDFLLAMYVEPYGPCAGGAFPLLKITHSKLGATNSGHRFPHSMKIDRGISFAQDNPFEEETLYNRQEEK